MKKAEKKHNKKYNIDKIALDLLTCSSDVEVCKKNDISVTTLFRIKKKKSLKIKLLK